MLRSGKYRGEKVLYPDGVGCCIWLPFDEDETGGLAYDFSFDDIDEIISLLHLIKQAEPVVYQDEAGSVD
jgi:hypothetical protein